MAKDELSPELTKKIDESVAELVKIIASINDEKFLNDFFGCLFSPAEMFDFGKRWLLVKEMNEGKTQREIAKDFKMSLCKITRGSKELKKENSAFRIMLDSIDEAREKQRKATLEK
ncbi:MAG: trp operon repressor [Treponemataceae bacterium]|nr:trp operon repressor [Treponemataceae bacterium]